MRIGDYAILKRVESVSELLCINANETVLIYDRLIHFTTIYNVMPTLLIY